MTTNFLTTVAATVTLAAATESEKRISASCLASLARRPRGCRECVASSAPQEGPVVSAAPAASASPCQILFGVTQTCARTLFIIS